MTATWSIDTVVVVAAGARLTEPFGLQNASASLPLGSH